MEINDVYSYKDGEKYIKKFHPNELKEVFEAVKNINIKQALSKQTHEKTKSALLFSPINMNIQLKKFLSKKKWIEKRIFFKNKNASREMDGLKNRIGLEIQFGKYAFMAYDIFSKMPIFKNRNLIDCGIELVLSHSMIKHMSTGVSSFRQIILDIESRGESDIDIPTLILGFECTESDWKLVKEIREKFSSNRKIKLVNLKGNRPGPKK